jgi:hypothetical protein
MVRTGAFLCLHWGVAWRAMIKAGEMRRAQMQAIWFACMPALSPATCANPISTPPPRPQYLKEVQENKTCPTGKSKTRAQIEISGAHMLGVQNRAKTPKQNTESIAPFWVIWQSRSLINGLPSLPGVPSLSDVLSLHWKVLVLITGVPPSALEGVSHECCVVQPWLGSIPWRSEGRIRQGGGIYALSKNRWRNRPPHRSWWNSCAMEESMMEERRTTHLLE